MTRSFLVLEGTLVLLLFLGALLVVASALAAVFVHLFWTTAEWPTTYAEDLLRCCKGIAECWVAVVLLGAVLFYAPIREFLYAVKRVGPVERDAPPIADEDIPWPPKGDA